MAARNLEADALEQLVYQQESSTWRNAYLVGAQELRTGKSSPPLRRTLAMYAGIPESDLFDSLAVSLNGPKANGKSLNINWVFTDSNNKYLLTLENSVLNHFKDRQDANADMTISTDKPSFIKLMLLGMPLDQVIQTGQVQVVGKKDRLDELLGLFDTFSGDFNIMLP